MASSLRPQVLAGRVLLVAGAPVAGLATELAARGALVRDLPGEAAGAGPRPTDPGPVDLMLVSLATEPAGGTLAGSVAVPLNEAFVLLRELHPFLARAPGSVLCYLGPAAAGEVAAAVAESLRASTGSLVRTLAQEWAADGIRVNGAVAAAPLPVSLLADLVALLASPAGAMMTGQVLDLDAPRAGS